MTLHGICDNANYLESTLSQAEVKAGNIQVRRTLVMPGQEMQLRVINSAKSLKKVGTQSIVVVTTQSTGTNFQDFDGYCTELENFCALCGDSIYGIEIQNELDTPDWGISDDEIVAITKRAAPIIRNYGMKAFAPSLLTGPGEGRFAYIAERIHDDVDFMNVHPYYRSIAGYPYMTKQPDDSWLGWRFGTVEDAAHECATLCPWIQTAFTEWGCPVVFDGITEKTQWNATYSFQQFEHPSIAFAIQFCRDDFMVPNEELVESKYWGLIDLDNRPRLAWRNLLNGEAMPEYKLGFKEWYDLEPELLGDPLEDEHGGIEGLSQQKTENGLLTWVALPGYEGGMRTFYNWETGERRALPGGATMSFVI